MIFPLLLFGGLLAVLPGLPRVPYLPEFLWQLSPFVGVGIIVVGVAVGWLPLPQIEARIANMAVTVVVITALALLVGGWQFNAHYELHGAARVLATAQQQGSAVAHVGAYRGQYHFAGRLTKPLEIVSPGQLELWAARAPGRADRHLCECLAATVGAGRATAVRAIVRRHAAAHLAGGGAERRLARGS